MSYAIVALVFLVAGALGSKFLDVRYSHVPLVQRFDDLTYRIFCGKGN